MKEIIVEQIVLVDKGFIHIRMDGFNAYVTEEFYIKMIQHPKIAEICKEKFPDIS